MYIYIFNSKFTNIQLNILHIAQSYNDQIGGQNHLVLECAYCDNVFRCLR